MTLQEQFNKEIGNKYDNAMLSEYPRYLQEYAKWLESRIESLQSDNQWVSVKDRLPKVGDDVDIWFVNEPVKFRIPDCTFLIDYFESGEHGRFYLENVAHYMGKPAAPVKEGEG